MLLKVKVVALLLLSVLTMPQIVFSQTGMELFEKAQLAYEQSKPMEAISLAKKAAAMIKRDSGENHMAYATILDDLAAIYLSINQVNEAEAFSSTALNIILHEKGVNSIEYASSRINTGNILTLKGEHEQAEKVFHESIEIIEKIRGQNDSSYANAVSNLSNIYYYKQEYNKALPLLITALNIYKKYYPQRAQDYIYILVNLAELYSSIGSYQKSLDFFNEAIGLFSTGRLPETHGIYTLLLNNFAALHMKMLNYSKSDDYFKMAIANHLKYHSKQDFNYITPVNNLGYLQFKQKQYNKAITSFNEVLEFWKAQTGKSVFYAYTLNNLALVYQEKGELEVADSLYSTAAQICAERIGTENLFYARLMHNHGFTNQARGYLNKAFNNYRKTDSININYLAQNFYGLSAQDKLSLTSSLQILFQAIPSLVHLKSVMKTSEVAQEVFRTQLTLKNLVLRDQQDLFRAIRNTSDSSVKDLHAEWKKNKSLLVQQYAQQFAKKTKYTDSLERRNEILEQSLSQKSSSFLLHQQYFKLSVKDISAHLKPHETAVEFLRYSLFNGEWTDSIFYAALIIRHNDTFPQYVRLCTETELIKLLKPASCSVQDQNRVILDLYQPVLKKNGLSKGDILFNKIWKPLLPYLKQTNTVFVSPSSLLNQVSFQAIPSGNKKMLGDTYTFRYILSTGDIALKEMNTEPSISSISLWANINYEKINTPGISDSAKNNLAATDNIYFDIDKGSGGDCKTNTTWPALNAGLEQITGITSLFRKNEVDISVFQQSIATEETLKALHFNIPSVLHISTHGFFIRDTLANPMQNFLDWQPNTSTQPDPLLRSGIVLSGANAAWQGQQVTGQEDGIVTAYEIAQMDLSNAELVILDACESALGNVYGSEGVFGLQRAFKIAGANKVMMSLWKVPEKETNELMLDFYRRWQLGKPVYIALREAQQEMRKKNLPPYYWAGFIVAE